MKKFATLAVLTAIAGGAYAQSNVILFGIVDEAARYTKNGDAKSVKSLVSGGINTSRIGFRGTEDLGDGLKAGFWYEAGFNADSGTQSDASRFFNRRTTVSLLGGFGEARIGRDYTPTYLGYTDYDPFGDNGVAASSKFDLSLGTARDTGTRADNQITYLTPNNLGGFYARAAVAAGETVAGKRYIGGRAGYGAGPIDVSGSYGVTRVAPLAGENNFKTYDVGASYDFGVVKAMGYYQQSKFAEQKIANYSIGAIVPFGTSIVKAAYTHANLKGRNAANVDVNSNDANQYAVGYIYNLSKRTALYGTAAYIKNKGNATFAVSTPPAVTPAGGNSKGAEIGVRHIF